MKTFNLVFQLEVISVSKNKFVFRSLLTNHNPGESVVTYSDCSYDAIAPLSEAVYKIIF